MTRILLAYAGLVIPLAVLGAIKVAPWFAGFVVALALLHLVFPLMLWLRERD